MTKHDHIDPAAELQANAALPFEQARAMPRSPVEGNAFVSLQSMARDFLKTYFLVFFEANAPSSVVCYF